MSGAVIGVRAEMLAVVECRPINTAKMHVTLPDQADVRSNVVDWLQCQAVDYRKENIRGSMTGTTVAAFAERTTQGGI
jgi:hypothetical protein